MAVSQSSREQVSTSAISALTWHYGGTAIRSLSQFVMGVVLARMLGPEPMGIVAAAWIVIGLGNLVADFGFAAAVIQKPQLSEADIRYSFTMQLIVGGVLTVVVASMAPLAAQLLALPAMIPVLRVLAGIFFLQALGLTGSALLRRRLDFRGFQQAQAGSYLLAYCGVGLSLAALGYGIWSLVIAQLLQSLLFSAALYRRTRHSIRPLLRLDDHALGHFGVRVLSGNLLNWSLQNIDNVSIGRVFGVVALGLYNRAYMLLMVPIVAVVAVVQAVLFSAAARAQESPAALRQLYLDSLRGVALVLMPLFAGVAVIPDVVMEGLYGSRWLAAAPLLTPLAVSLTFYAIMALSTPVLQAAGRLNEELVRQFLSALIMVFALLVAGRISVSVTAWVVCAVFALRCVLVSSVTLKLTGVSWRHAASAMRGGVLIAVCVGVSLPLAASLAADLSPSARLLLVVSFAGLEMCGLLLLFPAFFLTGSLLLRLSRRTLGDTAFSTWLLTRAGVATAPVP
jgi:O-antigen/teichoic acid export membrane protein